MAFETYQKVIGTIRNISRGTSCCNNMISVWTEDRQTINFILTGETIVIDNMQLRRGMRIAAFYDTSLPAPAIFPPQYRAELITFLRPNQNVMLNFFDENLVAQDNSLQLNVSPRTNISTINGQRFLCRPGNHELLVYYTITTFSIPPQTPPQRIIVMCSGK